MRRQRFSSTSVAIQPNTLTMLHRIRDAMEAAHGRNVTIDEVVRTSAAYFERNVVQAGEGEGDVA